MIERIVLCTHLETNALFTTVKMTDPRIRPAVFPLAGEGDVRDLLGPHSLLLFCESFRGGPGDADICLTRGCFRHRPGAGFMDMVCGAFRHSGYSVSSGGNVFSGACVPRMPFRYPVAGVAVSEAVLTEGDGTWDMGKIGRLQTALASLFDDILAPATESAYERCFPLFYARRKDIWQDPRFFSAPIPQRFLNGKPSASLGAYLKAVDTHPELFRPGKDKVICHYFGSPMSGATVNTVINLSTGRITTRRSGAYHAKSVAWSEELKAYPACAGSSLPLPVIAEILRGGT